MPGLERAPQAHRSKQPASPSPQSQNKGFPKQINSTARNITYRTASTQCRSNSQIHSTYAAEVEKYKSNSTSTTSINSQQQLHPITQNSSAVQESAQNISTEKRPEKATNIANNSAIPEKLPVHRCTSYSSTDINETVIPSSPKKSALASFAETYIYPPLTFSFAILLYAFLYDVILFIWAGNSSIPYLEVFGYSLLAYYCFVVVLFIGSCFVEIKPLPQVSKFHATDEVLGKIFHSEHNEDETPAGIEENNARVKRNDCCCHLYDHLKRNELHLERAKRLDPTYITPSDRKFEEAFPNRAKILAPREKGHPKNQPVDPTIFNYSRYGKNGRLMPHKQSLKMQVLKDQLQKVELTPREKESLRRVLDKMGKTTVSQPKPLTFGEHYYYRAQAMKKYENQDESKPGVKLLHQGNVVEYSNDNLLQPRVQQVDQKVRLRSLDQDENHAKATLFERKIDKVRDQAQITVDRSSSANLNSRSSSSVFRYCTVDNPCESCLMKRKKTLTDKPSPVTVVYSDSFYEKYQDIYDTEKVDCSHLNSWNPDIKDCCGRDRIMPPKEKQAELFGDRFKKCHNRNHLSLVLD